METKIKIDITKVKSGMFWHEGNLFSFERLPDKKIKAVVELVEDGIIYGDLTASELFDIPEKNNTFHKGFFNIKNEYGLTPYSSSEFLIFSYAKRNYCYAIAK